MIDSRLIPMMSKTVDYQQKNHHQKDHRVTKMNLDNQMLNHQLVVNAPNDDRLFFLRPIKRIFFPDKIVSVGANFVYRFIQFFLAFIHHRIGTNSFINFFSIYSLSLHRFIHFAYHLFIILAFGHLFFIDYYFIVYLFNILFLPIFQYRMRFYFRNIFLAWKSKKNAMIWIRRRN